MQRFDLHGVARAAALAVAIAGIGLLAASGPGTRAGLWTWQTGLGMLKWSVYFGAAAAIVALVLVVLLAVPRFRARPWLPIAALVLGAAAAAPPLMMMSTAKSLPYIHDITTDFESPPEFASLAEVRRKAPNGLAYGGQAIAAEQRRGYPDIGPLVLKAPPREVMQRAIDAARAMGWEVVASDAASGHIEATDTTAWFGFKDDIAVRIRPEGEGSRVDVRSVSRVGLSDVGANARRVRSFLARLA